MTRMLKQVREIAAIVLLGIMAGVALSHGLQAGSKATYDAQLYVAVQQTLYNNYKFTIGLIEFGMIFLLGSMAWSDRRKSFLQIYSSLAFLCVLAMFAIWAVGLNPINQEIFSWSNSTIPTDWADWRNRWQFLHSIRAVLVHIALVSIAGRVVLRAKPSTSHSKHKQYNFLEELNHD